jgi:hypothetical protein
MNDSTPPSDWRDDPEAVEGVLKAAREQYESMKDNPYAAIGYANVVAALNRDYDKMRPIATATPTLWERFVAWLYSLQS